MLSNVPLAAFLLPTPPAEKPLPKDYRMLPEKEGKFDKKTVFAIRRTRRLQKISKELLENLNATMVSAIPKFPISNSPIELADKYRAEFNLTIEQQTKLKTSYKLAAYRLHTNPNYSHASSLFLSGGGFFLVKPTFSIIEPHFGHLILLFLIKFSGLQLFILLRKCFAYIFLVLLEYAP